MSLIVLTSRLLRAVQRVSTLKSDTIYLEARDQRICVCASSRDHAAVSWIDLDNTRLQHPLSIAVSTKTLVEALRLCDFSIELSISERALTIRDPLSRFQMHLMGASHSADQELYARMLALSSENAVLCTDFADAFLSTALFSEQVQFTRPVLTGVLVSWDEQLFLAAADGYRLLIRHLSADGVHPKDAWIIPVQPCVSALQRCRLTRLARFDQRRVLLESEDARFVFRLIDGKYPDLSPVLRMRQPDALVFTCPIDALERVISACVPFARENNNAVALHISDDRQLCLRAHARARGDIDVLLPGSFQSDVDPSYLQTVFPIGCNLTYLRDFVRAMKPRQPKTVSFHLQPNAPIFLTVDDDDPEDQLAVIMPMSPIGSAS